MFLLSRILTTLQPVTIELENCADLLLIVGGPERPDGKKRFKVCSQVLKIASPVWKAMLSGRFRESTQQEVEFPDDDPDAFLIVLRIAHLQSKDLPKEMTREKLIELALFRDKYDVTRLVQPYVISNSWIEPYKSRWPGDLQDWLLVTKVFGMTKEYDTLFAILVINIGTVSGGRWFCAWDRADLKERDGLPESLLKNAKKVRLELLDEFLKKSYEILDLNLKTATCSDPNCQTFRVGNLVQAYHKIGIAANRLHASRLGKSVYDFRRELSAIKLKPYNRHWNCASKQTWSPLTSNIGEAYLTPEVLQLQQTRFKKTGEK